MCIRDSLQEDPAQIPRLLAELDDGAALVCGCRTPRVDGLWKKRIPSAIYGWLLTLLFGRRFHDINCGFRAARREVWRDVVWFSGAHRLVPLLVALRGGAVAQIPVTHRPRMRGQAKFDSPLRFFEGVRDLLRVRFGRIPRARQIPLQERVVG